MREVERREGDREGSKEGGKEKEGEGMRGKGR